MQNKPCFRAQCWGNDLDFRFLSSTSNTVFHERQDKNMFL